MCQISTLPDVDRGMVVCSIVVQGKAIGNNVVNSETVIIITGVLVAEGKIVGDLKVNSIIEGISRRISGRACIGKSMIFLNSYRLCMGNVIHIGIWGKITVCVNLGIDCGIIDSGVIDVTLAIGSRIPGIRHFAVVYNMAVITGGMVQDIRYIKIICDNNIIIVCCSLDIIIESDNKIGATVNTLSRGRCNRKT